MSEQVFTLPDLGEGLTEAELVRWLVKVGDTIAVDEPVAGVETAKATVEVPAPFSGVVARLHGDEGDVIQVGEPLISVDDRGPSGAAATYVEEERAGSGNVLIGYGTCDAAPSRRRRGKRAPAPVHAGSTRHRDRPAVQSPIVRQFARRAGVDLNSLTGTGPDGLILRRDVEAATENPTTGESSPQEGETPTAGAFDRRTGLPVGTRVPLTGLRKAVSETLSRSRS